jgi:hypothetical protein
MPAIDTPPCPKCGFFRSNVLEDMGAIKRYRCIKCQHVFTASVPRYCIPNTYFIWNHQEKGDCFVNALTSHGFVKGQSRNSQVYLIDVDVDGKINPIARLLKHGRARLFVYPHAARPFIGWDGLFTWSRHTSAAFVFAEGHIDVIKRYGYEKPLHSIGWAYSPILDFKPHPNPKKILFAPIHPNNNGYLSELDTSINKSTMDILIDMIEKHGMEVTVRHVKTLEQNGLRRDERVTYIHVDTKMGKQWDFNDYDLVIGHQTIAYISVALGHPTIMMAEFEAPRNGGSDADFTRVNSWDKYKDLMMYPLDILFTDNPYGLIMEACTSDERIKDWKKRMIGCTTFDAEKFVSIVKSYL